MAKFGINKEGVAALRQLEKDLKSINTEIETSGKTLKAAVSGIGEGLGIYEEKILELVDSRVDRALLRMVADGQIDQVELPVFEALMDLAARANKAYYEIRFAKGRES